MFIAIFVKGNVSSNLGDKNTICSGAGSFVHRFSTPEIKKKHIHIYIYMIWHVTFVWWEAVSTSWWKYGVKRLGKVLSNSKVSTSK